MSHKFFGAIDRTKDGRISSQVPAWSMATHIDELNENIASRERNLERGMIPYDAVHQVKEELKVDKEKLDKILSSKPKLTDVEQDEVYKVYKSFSKDIKDMMFSRSEEKKGLASPHEEARRMIDPIIKVNEKTAQLCKDNGVKVTETREGLKVSRNGATKVWKIIGRYLGENSNAEYLRKD